jgi:dienelactone hydrolase
MVPTRIFVCRDDTWALAALTRGGPGSKMFGNLVDMTNFCALPGKATRVRRSLTVAGMLAMCGLAAITPRAHAAQAAETVQFPSRDGKTQLTGYLFRPQRPGPYPAVVMLHGRSGPYSSLRRGTYTAETLTLRHKIWGNFWAERGYLALHVDSFGPRGFPDGFPKHSYSERPSGVSERFVRPLDAYGALDYLRGRADVIADRIGVQGWSNGGMTVLSTMGQHAPGIKDANAASGFRAAMALYPSCRTQVSEGNYSPYAPLLILAASDDDEVSPMVCQMFAAEAQARGGAVEFVLYQGAHHAYDDPGHRKQSHEPNRYAMRDSLHRAENFFRSHLKP